MKRAWPCLVICAVVLWMVPMVASSYSQRVLQAPEESPALTPTVFNHLPLLFKNWGLNNLGTIVTWDGRPAATASLLCRSRQEVLADRRQFLPPHLLVIVPIPSMISTRSLCATMHGRRMIRDLEHP